MPTYEYRCPACGTDFEKFQKMSDEPVADCPSCGSPAVRQLSAGAGLHFKGSGFYITDYKKSGSSGADKSGGEGGGGEKKGGDAPAPKSDAKPAPKSE